jgi:formylglycine-generating enzyme required for sulfatase activity
MFQGKVSAELRTEITQELLRQIELKPVSAGHATIGLEEALAAKFTRSYGEDWREFYYRETPQHTVDVAAFDLAHYPVTNALYARFIASGGYETPEYWTPEGWAWRENVGRTAPLFWDDPKFAGDSRPVVGVSWYEAFAFTRWASALTGRAIRLPSEVEWEWAARSENVRWLYPWGGTFNPDHLNAGVAGISGETVGSTVPVGTYSPKGDGPFGHGDQLGQVWEWTLGAFAPYPYQAEDGREDPYSPARRVLRGGSWGDGKYANRVTTRLHYPPHYSDPTTGFRIAANIDGRAAVERPPYDLVVYGKTSFCPDLINTKRWLRDMGVPYRELSIDLDDKAAFRLDDWLGMRVVPTLVVAPRGGIEPIEPPKEADLRHLRSTDRGTMLHEPDEQTLRAWLTRNGFLKE